MIRQFVLRLLLVTGLLAALTGIAGCSSHSSTPNTTVGVGVILSTSGSTSLLPGGSVTITANVLNDPNGKGVTWTLSGLGTLSANTSTTVVYTAPAALSGVTSATITATSVADTTKYSNVTAATSGAPVLQASTILPANQNVGYGTSVSVYGGVAGYIWKVVGGQLPPGLTLNGSTGATIGISGTPKAIGTWPFTLQVTDAYSRVAQGNYSIVVNPQPSCLLAGTFAYKLNGFSRTGAAATRSGWFTVNANGQVTGTQTLKSDIGVKVDEPIVSGTCQNQVLNRGQLNFTAASGTLTFNFALLPSLDEGFMQELDASGIAGTATIARIDQNATSLDKIAGDYAFGLIGSDSKSVRLGLVGQVALSAAGAITAGRADSNGSLGLASTGAALTGSLSAQTPPSSVPPGVWHGTLAMTVGGTPLNFGYYAVSTVGSGRRLYLIETDTTASPILVGDMTPQVSGLGAASFAPPAAGNTAEVPAIMEYVAATGAHYPTTEVQLGQFTNGNATAGTVDLVLDDATGSAVTYGTPYLGNPYSVAADGRLTLKVGSRTFIGYLSGTSAGYLIETTAGASGGGYAYLESQSNLPFTLFVGATNYVGSTILPGAISPLSLLPSVAFQSGVLGGNMSGQYALDASTGRGVATVSRSLFGGTGLVFYLVNDHKIVLMGNGANAINPQLGWLVF